MFLPLSAVETADKDSGLKYVQTFSENMSKKTKPKVRSRSLFSPSLSLLFSLTLTFDPPSRSLAKQITQNPKGEEYTKITFQPDLVRFGMDTIDDDTASLLMKRAYDMAGTVRGVKVWLDGTRLKVDGFKKVRRLSLLFPPSSTRR